MDCRYSFFHGGLRLLLAVSASLVMASIRADVDVSEYDPRASVSDRKSQQRYLRQIEIDKQAEAVREAERLLEEQRAEAERRRIEEARPWPERLTVSFQCADRIVGIHCRAEHVCAHNRDRLVRSHGSIVSGQKIIPADYREHGTAGADEKWPAKRESRKDKQSRRAVETASH